MSAGCNGRSPGKWRREGWRARGSEKSGGIRQGAMTNHATILLAEDDQNDVLLAQRALEKAGLDHVLMHVPDGGKCISYLRGDAPYDDRSKYPFPNLLLLDLKMPRVSGFDVLAWMHDQPHLKELPVIILTGSILSSDREAAEAKGANDFQVKPVQFEELVKIMKALNARWLTKR
jgi:CheY-like chemotaxis protein